MPANKKYLTKSPWYRLLKITAGFIGGYIITQAFFMLLINLWNPSKAMVTLLFGGFILWVSLMVLAFLAKNPFKLWGIYLFITLLLSLALYLTR